MQYFSIIARSGNGHGRPCAMLQDSTIEAAAEKARRIIRAEHLNYVEKSAAFSIRKSSRRETALLQNYLASCSGARLSTYLQEDLDGLLGRRNSLLLSFFMALYLDPEKLRARFDPSAPGKPPVSGAASDTSSGSGGISFNPAAAGRASEDQDQDQNSAENSDEAAVGNDSQISALDHIVNGGDAADPVDVEIELF